MEANSHQGISQCATEAYKQIKHKTLLISDIYQNFYSKTALYLHFLGKKNKSIFTSVLMQSSITTKQFFLLSH